MLIILLISISLILSLIGVVFMNSHKSVLMTLLGLIFIFVGTALAMVVFSNYKQIILESEA
jgi:hypothetical protein